jgi:hypothetical protein
LSAVCQWLQYVLLSEHAHKTLAHKLCVLSVGCLCLKMCMCVLRLPNCVDMPASCFDVVVARACTHPMHACNPCLQIPVSTNPECRTCMRACRDSYSLHVLRPPSCVDMSANGCMWWSQGHAHIPMHARNPCAQTLPTNCVQTLCVGSSILVQFGTKVWAAEVCSAALAKTQRKALILCLSP